MNGMKDGNEPPFTLTYHRDTCLFDFAHNLAGWHYACSTYYSKIWLSETGDLTATEREALDCFARIARQFPYGDSWIGIPFVRRAGDPSMWFEVESILGSSLSRDLRAALLAIEPRFNLIWAKDVPRLEALMTRLRHSLSVPEAERAMRTLEVYLGCPFPEVTVHLLLSRGKGSASGGANEGPGHITLAALETVDLGRAVEMVFHEVMHLMEEAVFAPLFDEMSRRRGLFEYGGDESGEDGWNAHWLLKEALTFAVAPGGCLSQILGRPLRDYTADAAEAAQRGDYQSAGLIRLTGSYVPLVTRYFGQSRTIDELLFEEAFSMFSRELDLHGRAALGLAGGKEPDI